MSSMQQPFFSILIPSFNRPEYLIRCLHSILRNDYKDFEVIISDDKSPAIDVIERSLAPFCKNTAIKFFKQSKNLGWSDNRNFLVANASGKYSILLGDDDMLLPSTLSILKKYIESFPDYDLFAIGYTVIDEDDDVCYTCVAQKKIEISLAHPHLLKLLLFSDVIPFWVFHPFTICFVTQLRDHVRYIKDALIGDDLLWMYDSMNSGKKMLVIPKSLFLWRKAQRNGNAIYQNLSTSGMNSVKARASILLYMKRKIRSYDAISTTIKSDSFKRRFLFDSVTFDKSITSIMLEDFKNSDAHIRALFDSYKVNRNIMTDFRIRFVHLASFLRIFGIKGGLHLAGRYWQKKRYLQRKSIIKKW